MLDRQRIDIPVNICIENFGPITTGNIAVKPLTILIGPNNSGKSYAAMLIHAILRSHSPTRRATYSLTARYNTTQFKPETFFEKYPKIKKQANDLLSSQRFEVPSDIIDAISYFIFDKLYKEQLTSEIQWAFASPLSQLIRHNKNFLQF